jgi:hypothetical protein
MKRQASEVQCAARFYMSDVSVSLGARWFWYSNLCKGLIYVFSVVPMAGVFLLWLGKIGAT